MVIEAIGMGSIALKMLRIRRQVLERSSEEHQPPTAGYRKGAHEEE